MSASLRLVKKRRNQKARAKSRRKRASSLPPVVKLLRTKEKRVRLVLLTCAIVLISIGLFLPEVLKQPGKPVATGGDIRSTSFISEPVSVDKKLLGVRKNKKEQTSPQRIIIPTIGLDLAVKEAKVIKGYWEVFPDVAGFGEGSAYPGEIGNQVIFAHARKGLFIDLPKIGKGDKFYIITKTNWYQYSVIEKKEVSPSQTEVIAPTDDETVTLYTCSGFGDQKRLIIIAKRQ